MHLHYVPKSHKTHNHSSDTECKRKLYVATIEGILIVFLFKIISSFIFAYENDLVHVYSHACLCTSVHISTGCVLGGVGHSILALFWGSFYFVTDSSKQNDRAGGHSISGVILFRDTAYRRQTPYGTVALNPGEERRVRGSVLCTYCGTGALFSFSTFHSQD